MEIPPAERLEIYKKMLPYFEGEERIVDNLFYVYGFCRASFIVTKVRGSLYDLPELTKREPKDCGSFWFPVVQEGRDINRTNLLKQAIEEVKQLI